MLAEIDSLPSGMTASDSEAPALAAQVEITVLGIGGAGSNMIETLAVDPTLAIRCAVVNTEWPSLERSQVAHKLLIGRKRFRGLGVGGEVASGKAAAIDDLEAIGSLTAGAKVVFLLAGLGGGTGSGATPVIAEALNQKGVVVIAFVALPFSFEGAKRVQQAQEGLASLRGHCHAVIPVPNDLILQHLGKDSPVQEAFSLGMVWVQRGINALSSLLQKPGFINVDFATFCQAFACCGGKALFGIGQGDGEGCVQKALENLWVCPLLHTMENARSADSLIVYITGGPGLSMQQLNSLVDALSSQFGSEAIVLGALIDDAWQGKVEVVVLGTTDINAGKNQRALSPDSAGRDRATVDQPNNKPKKKRFHHAEKGEQNQVQTTFDFVNEEQRGCFVETEQNFYQGEDLDVPTYLRRGIKISLS